MDAGDGLIGSGVVKSEDEARIEKERAQFVAALISLLEEALSRDLLSFTAVKGMNFEEVSINVHQYGFDVCYVVLGRLDKRREYRPYAAEHTLRICNFMGADAYWFPPFVLNDSTGEDELLRALRDRLANFHARLMGKAPRDRDRVSGSLFKQNLFLATLGCCLTSNGAVLPRNQGDLHYYPF